MAERLFVFIQLEFPWALGPADGRYLLRSREGADPESVVVFTTVGAQRSDGRALGARRARRRARGPGREASREPERVSIARVTVIDPVSLSAEQQAKAWLAELDRDHDVSAAMGTVNRVLELHRIAAADPYVHELSPAAALAIRAGWGVGEQVADGRWLHARELPWEPRERERSAERGPRRRLTRRAAGLRPVERLAALMTARARGLVCEELALRARADLDAGRVRLAAIELERAYAAALAELRSEQREDLALRISELEKLREGVAEQARAAVAQLARADGEEPPEPDEDALAHPLERLEAALRARSAEL